MVEKQYVVATSDKSKKTTLILACIGFLGFAGLHDFYLGNIGKGILKFATFGYLLIGTISDVIKISSGVYKDAAGMPVKQK